MKKREQIYTFLIDFIKEKGLKIGDTVVTPKNKDKIEAGEATQ